MSGVYIGVDGKARKVKGGYIGVDGKARKIKKGYIGVDGVAQLCWTTIEFDPVFANNTWEEIALACQMGAVPDSWAVGDQKTMTIGGTDYAIDIIGKDHDDYADGSGKAPLTFQFNGVYVTPYQMNGSNTNTGGWLSSNMRISRLPNILSQMPNNIQSAIKGVTKKSSKGAASPEIITSTDKLFLLSESEVKGTTDNSFDGEGTQYNYYKLGNNTIKKLNATAKFWWLRSPYIGNSINFCIINGSGNASHLQSSYTDCYVSPAFCF